MSEKGFSLIEIITALVVISILAVGLSATTAYSRQIEIFNRDRMQVGAILEKTLMEARQGGTNNLAAGTTTRTITKGIDGVDGTLTTQIIVDSDNPKDRLIRVRVDWDNRSESLATYLFEE